MRAYIRGMISLAIIGLAGIDVAEAEGWEGTFELFGESRLRLETADEANLAEDAVGLTQLIRPAIEFQATSRLTALFEGEAIFAIVDDFNDGTDNVAERPLILDPNGLELNRLQLQYALQPQTFLTVGRQRLAIDDQRFIGRAAFRQNDQTFDAVHFATRSVGSSTFQAGYFNRVNRILGADNPIGRFRGDSYYFNANIPTPVGRVGAFHYAFDLGTAGPTAQDNVFSSRTTGARIDGRFHRDTVGIDWAAAYARQTDFADNPADYSADYWLLSLETFVGPARLNVRYEVLGGGGEQSFQVPLGSLHQFQGAADVFLVTPPEGIEDLQIRGRWNFGRKGPFRNISTALSYHRFEAEATDDQLGSEIDFDITAAFGDFALSLTAAYYDADTFATDTRRFFLSLTHRF
ncbi:MAG: alginate export family protein [Pseudomonadota bacterium]